jgi:Tfp pilus tip-associated adhesin PilY1
MKLTEKYNVMKNEAAEVAPEKQVFGLVEQLKQTKWSEKNESQINACNQMMKLAEMDDKKANKFMEYMDEMSSKYESKKSESMDEAKSPLDSLESGANNFVADIMKFHSVSDLSDVKGNAGKKKKILDDIEYAQGVLDMAIKTVNKRL